MSSIFKGIGTGVVLALVCIEARPVEAKVPCAPRHVIVERLKTGYGEGPAGLGLQSSGRLFEVWAAPSTGTWTFLMSLADGNSCVIATGTDWQNIDLEELPVGIPG